MTGTIIYLDSGIPAVCPRCYNNKWKQSRAHFSRMHECTNCGASYFVSELDDAMYGEYGLRAEANYRGWNFNDLVDGKMIKKERKQKRKTSRKVTKSSKRKVK